MRLLKALPAIIVLCAFAHASVPLSNFDTVLGIQRDGSVVVVEKFSPVSPQKSVHWVTSTEYRGTWGIHDPRVIEILQVTSLEGAPLNYELRRNFGRLDVKIDASGAKGIRLVYSIRNGVRFLADRDELQWTAGSGWRGETQKATLFVQVPPELAGVATTQAYLQGRGLLLVRESEAGPDRVWFDAGGRIGEHERLFVDVVLPKGALREPSLAARLGWFLAANSIVLLPLITLVAMFVLRTLKRLPTGLNYSLTPQYEPPEGLTPAEVGLLIDDSLDPRDVTATLIDLAVRGYVRLEPCKPDDEVTFEGHDFKLVSLKSKEDWRLLPLHERTLLFHTFYGGEWTKLSSLNMRFFSIVPLIRRQVIQLLRTKGMYWTDPDYALSARMSLLVIFLALALIIQLLGVYSFASSWLLSLISIGISAAIVYYFGRGITSKTMKGLRAFEQILGFEHFLDTVESDRLERLPAETFEKWLPYAMALGVEHHWTRNFEGIATPKLEWMAEMEDAIFDTRGLVSALAALARESASKSSFSLIS